VSEKWLESWLASLPEEQAFRETVDPEYLIDFAGRLSDIGMYDMGFRPSGSRAGHEAADFIADEMRALGLQDVRKEPFPVYAWGFAGASIEVAGWDPLPASQFPPTPGTPAEGLAATLVDVGRGTAQDYLSVDVRDAVAFVHLEVAHFPWLGDVAYEAELNGARAVVFYYRDGYAQHESGQALNTHNGTARPTIPLVQIAKGDGERLAQRLADEGPLEVTLRSRVEGDPDGTGYNVIGTIPGRLPDHYIITGAHYDAWFSGFRDNAVGVAATLAIARGLLQQGYRPEHTLLFVATDAEEFGAADTIFDWLIGCYHLMEGHPEWHGKVSVAFNIDGLAAAAYEQVGFAAVPELLPFARQVLGGMQATSFPNPEVWTGEQLTAWTDALTYAYFGAPPLQCRYRPKEAREKIHRESYHTQFDDASLVDAQRTAETVGLYGTLLLRLDRQPVLPYEFAERARSLRAITVDALSAEAEQEVSRLKEALDGLERRAQRFAALLSELDGLEPGPAWAEINDRLRQTAAHLVENLNYLDGAGPEHALPLHVFYERDLRALDMALEHLTAGEASQAMSTLTDRETGVRGAAYAMTLSYPAYHRFALRNRNPGRDNLFWGRDRTPATVDLWMELHTLQDKLARGVDDYAAEVHTLGEKRRQVAASYREAVATLAGVVEEAADLLPLEELIEIKDTKRSRG